MSHSESPFQAESDFASENNESLRGHSQSAEIKSTATNLGSTAKSKNAGTANGSAASLEAAFHLGSGIGLANAAEIPGSARLPDDAKLPDVANDRIPEIAGRLERVGMSGIELILRLDGADQIPMRVPAIGDAYVSLENDDVKGIHMSRLFLALTGAMDKQSLSPSIMRDVCDEFIESHRGISHQSELKIRYQHPAWRPALLSDFSAPRHYPVSLQLVTKPVPGVGTLAGSADVERKMYLEVQVVYSSTCPCSAALSRQLLEQKFQDDFAFHNWVNVSSVSQWLQENGSIATPHSQRSIATVKIEIEDPFLLRQFPVERLIDRIEASLKTAVQTVVKRRDEQEFARLNGANQMFCEDAARRIKQALVEMPEAADFRIEARHMESLHPHDAVAIATKGIVGGLEA